MNIKLNYKIDNLEERIKIVDEICKEHADELSTKNLETLSDYILNLMEKDEKKKKEILTQNRMSTVNKREMSFEGLAAKFENGEDGVYQLMKNDKNMILTPAIKITKKDIEELPFIAQIRDAIAFFRNIENKNYIVQQAIVDLSQQQYAIKNAYRKPIQFRSLVQPQSTSFDWDDIIDFKNYEHIAALIKNYSKLKTKVSEEINNEIYWVLIDLEMVIDAALEEKYPMLYDILIDKIEGVQNVDVQKNLEQKYGKSYSIEYLSNLFNNKIPKLIAEEAEKQELIWHYTYVEKGAWKKCNRCGQIKLLHSKFFSKNSSSKNGFYSICKDCRKK